MTRSDINLMTRTSHILKATSTILMNRYNPDRQGMDTSIGLKVIRVRPPEPSKIRTINGRRHLAEGSGRLCTIRHNVRIRHKANKPQDVRSHRDSNKLVHAGRPVGERDVAVDTYSGTLQITRARCVLTIRDRDRS